MSAVSRRGSGQSSTEQCPHLTAAWGGSPTPSSGVQLCSSAALVNTNDLPRSEAIQSNLTTSFSAAPVPAPAPAAAPDPATTARKVQGGRRPAPDQRLHPEQHSAAAKTVVRNGNTTFCSDQYSHTTAGRILTKPLQPPGVAPAAGSRAAAPRHSIHTTTQPGPAAGLIRDGKVGMRNYRSRSRGRWRVIYNADTG